MIRWSTCTARAASCAACGGAGRASKAGDRFEVEVAEQGFGKRHEGLVQTLPRSLLGADTQPQVGARFKAQTARGPLDVVVTAVDADTVTVDGNHPLAGRPFRARVEVVDVRLASPEEIQFGVGSAATRGGLPVELRPCRPRPHRWPTSCWWRCRRLHDPNFAR